MADEVLVIRDAELLTLRDSTQEVLDLTKISELVEIAQQGPPGPPGPQGPAGGTARTAIAGENLGGHRAVILDADNVAFYADQTNLSHLFRVAGITSGAVVVGDFTTIMTSGVFSEPSWAWAPDLPIFLGTSGLLTQTPPIGGFQQVLAVAISPTSIFVGSREPLITA